MTFNLTKASSYHPRRITEDIEVTTLEELMELVQEKGDIIIYKTSCKEVKDGCFDYNVEKPTICIYDDYVE